MCSGYYQKEGGRKRPRVMSIIFGVMVALAGVAFAAKGRAEGGNGRAITLSCKGTASLLGYNSSEQIKKMDIIVNVSSHSVIGFGGVVAQISKIDKNGIAFSGDRSIAMPGMSKSSFSSSVVGFATRVGGEVTATVTTVTLTSRILSKKFDLRCERLSKLLDIAIEN